MTKDEMMKLAEECGATVDEHVFFYGEHFESYTREVAKRTKDRCAKVCEHLAWTHPNTAMMGPEQRSLRCAEAIRKMEG